MSGTHADSERTTPPRDADGEPVDTPVADPTALNGGPARHWYAPGEDEPLRTPYRGAKVGTAVLFWGALLATVVLLAALA